MKIEQRLAELGIELNPPPSGNGPYGQRYGRMKPFFISGRLLFLCGHTAGLDNGVPRFPGRLGHDLSIDEGYQAARRTGINCLSTIKRALGDLDRVSGIASSVNFIASTPDFFEHHKVTNGLTDLLADVFGDDIGVGPRASLGTPSLSDNYCFETSLTLQID
ncbi:RidA family protein [Solimonas marina]|uniref:RidA family protein n=1 Tax=Solimonas marina TaxID=2714601 RepID=A0A969WF22_9GAMM|nr:RidA family protein [Solimonas marina]NKF23565.1 RidA family protein [Solimonas marina]